MEHGKTDEDEGHARADESDDNRTQPVVGQRHQHADTRCQDRRPYRDEAPLESPQSPHAGVELRSGLPQDHAVTLPERAM